MTYTYVEMDVSQPTYDEVKAKLREAEYGHAIGQDGALDMHGLALVLNPDIEPRAIVTSSGPADPAQDAIDAEKWRALIGCARLRPLGSAGLDKDGDDPDYGHMGIDMWTKHPPWEHTEPQREIAIAWLDKFVAKALRIKRSAG